MIFTNSSRELATISTQQTPGRDGVENSRNLTIHQQCDRAWPVEHPNARDGREVTRNARDVQVFIKLASSLLIDDDRESMGTLFENKRCWQGIRIEAHKAR